MKPPSMLCCGRRSAGVRTKLATSPDRIEAGVVPHTIRSGVYDQDRMCEEIHDRSLMFGASSPARETWDRSQSCGQQKDVVLQPVRQLSCLHHRTPQVELQIKVELVRE